MGYFFKYNIHPSVTIFKSLNYWEHVAVAVKEHNKIRQILIANKNDYCIVASAMNVLVRRMSRLC